MEDLRNYGTSLDGGFNIRNFIRSRNNNSNSIVENHTPTYVDVDNNTLDTTQSGLENESGNIESLLKEKEYIDKQLVQENKFSKENELNSIFGNLLYKYNNNTANISNEDSSFLNALGKVESNNNYFAKPNASGYETKYQFRFRDKGDAGNKYAKIMGVTPSQIRKSPELQESMMQLALKDYDRDISRRGKPVNNWTRWLRHNQGGAGMSAILNGKLTPIIRRNIKNQGVTGNTDFELISNYNRKFQPRFVG